MLTLWLKNIAKVSTCNTSTNSDTYATVFTSDTTTTTITAKNT